LSMNISLGLDYFMDDIEWEAEKNKVEVQDDAYWIRFYELEGYLSEGEKQKYKVGEYAITLGEKERSEEKLTNLREACVLADVVVDQALLEEEERERKIAMISERGFFLEGTRTYLVDENDMVVETSFDCVENPKLVSRDIQTQIRTEDGFESYYLPAKDFYIWRDRMMYAMKMIQERSIIKQKRNYEEFQKEIGNFREAKVFEPKNLSVLDLYILSRMTKCPLESDYLELMYESMMTMGEEGEYRTRDIEELHKGEAREIEIEDAIVIGTRYIFQLELAEVSVIRVSFAYQGVFKFSFVRKCGYGYVLFDEDLLDYILGEKESLENLRDYVRDLQVKVRAKGHVEIKRSMWNGKKEMDISRDFGRDSVMQYGAYALCQEEKKKARVLDKGSREIVKKYSRSVREEDEDGWLDIQLRVWKFRRQNKKL